MEDCSLTQFPCLLLTISVLYIQNNQSYSFVYFPSTSHSSSSSSLLLTVLNHNTNSSSNNDNMFNNSNLDNVYDPYYSSYHYSSSSSSSPVDCTLSLGSASTRHTSVDNNKKKSETSKIPRIYWDLSPDQLLGSSSSTAAGSSDGRRCANCSTTSTPLWRNGPNGPKSLCNACGIRYKKEERRAASEATLSTPALMYSSPTMTVESNRLSSIGYSSAVNDHHRRYSSSSAHKTKGLYISENKDNLGYCYDSWCLNSPHPPPPPHPRAEFLQN